MTDVATSVSFNGVSLQDATYRSRLIQHTDIPQKFIQTEQKSRQDGSTIVNVRYSGRIIEVQGNITGSTAMALDQNIDALKRALRSTNGTLDISFAGTTRRYFATVQRFDVPKDYYHLTVVPYEIVFFCADPFGYATSSGIVNIAGNTGLLTEFPITVSGTIETHPVHILTINSATNFAQLNLENITTGELIIVTKAAGNFAATDQVIIDSRRKQVFINGSGRDYTGTFLTIGPTSTTYRVIATADALNYDYKVQYPPAFL
jgi:predicted phage tail component-like protein